MRGIWSLKGWRRIGGRGRSGCTLSPRSFCLFGTTLVSCAMRCLSAPTVSVASMEMERSRLFHFIEKRLGASSPISRSRQLGLPETRGAGDLSTSRQPSYRRPVGAQAICCSLEAHDRGGARRGGRQAAFLRRVCRRGGRRGDGAAHETARWSYPYRTVHSIRDDSPGGGRSCLA